MFPKRQNPERVVAEARARAEAAAELKAVRDGHPDPTVPELSTDAAVVRHWRRTTRRTARAAITYATEKQLRAQRRDHKRALADERQAQRLEQRAATLEAARDESSSERAVLALSAVRGRVLAVLLATSVALSVGSAIGLAALSEFLTGRAVDGAVAELAGTAISTAALLYLAHLHRWGTGAPSATVRGLLWVMAFVPTTISAGANVAGIVLGAPVSFLNAVCAVGALAASALAYLVAQASSAEIRTQGDLLDAAAADRVRQQRDALLRTDDEPAPAVGEHAESAADAPAVPDPRVEGPQAVSAELLDLPEEERLDALARVLESDEARGVVLDLLMVQGLQESPVPDDASGLTGGAEQDGGGGVAAPPDPGGKGAEASAEPDGPDSSAQSAQGGRDRAARARKARREKSSVRRGQALQLWHEGLSVAQIAEQMTRDPRTITGYLLDVGVSREDMARRAGGGPS